MNSNIDFKNITYLKGGNDKQRHVYEVLSKNEIMTILNEFDPILVGTIPINIDIENSDLDIVCHFTDKHSIEKLLVREFGTAERFKIWKNTSQESLAIVANFFMDGFEIEIFGQNVPTVNQRAYRHMIIEHNLLLEHGDEFRKRIIKLKEKGYKTEPAFAIELGLKGDPYEALLELEK
ncbi:DUF4269 domain-containing protein [Carboxylicivirga sp. N1Y90]|uniref:DUF4269 domain-containing protein n=1 Tax=Carboxylicivirga fragile TaxID=3417571 RepID=UPI003D34F9E2|nr:DUF4269 domain-containing protein [Marinilabiliaceae bacterium N1Y90]